MKMKKKMRIGNLLALCLILVLISGCGPTAGPSSSPPDDSTSSPAPTPTPGDTTSSPGDSANGLIDPEKSMTITLWDIATEGSALEIQGGAVERFMTAYPNITVESTHTQNDSYKQKLVVAMSSGQCPNVYMHWGGGPMNEYIDSGFAVPITDLMNNYNEVKFLKAAIAQCTYKGEVYAVPYNGIGGSGIFYNKTIFENLGLSVPGTIAELETTCDTLLANGYIPFTLANQSKWTGSMYFMYLVARYGGVDEFNAAVAGTGSFESPAFQYAAETIQKWVRAGYFPEGVNSMSTDDGQDRQLLYQEKAGMMLHGSWLASMMPGDNAEWYETNIGYFGFPKLDTSSADQSIVVGTSIGNGLSFNTGNDEDLRKACFVLATQFYNDDVYNQALLDTNTIPCIEGMGDGIQDACMQQVWKDFSNAANVQLWYDQYLPPEVGETHKDTCQEIFGLIKTPAEANKILNDAMQAYLQGR